jgi:hypothetical protein
LFIVVFQVRWPTTVFVRLTNDTMVHILFTPLCSVGGTHPNISTAMGPVAVRRW